MDTIIVMREQICIVLNEREPRKAEAASRLEAALKSQGFSCLRLEIKEDIEERILSLAPKVLVLDYLLGDFSTGLDVFEKFASTGVEYLPTVFFLTDEPGVQVAVEAMRLGAKDYLELDNPKSIDSLTQSITLTLKTAHKPKIDQASLSQKATVDTLVFQDKESLLVRQQALLALKKPAPITILYGEEGSGKKTLATAIHNSLEEDRSLRVLDLSLFVGDLKAALGFKEWSFSGQKASFIVLNAEEDDGALLDLTSKYFAEIGIDDNREFSQFFICTAERETTAAWKRIFPEAQLISIPSLSTRPDDLAPLARYFAAEAMRHFGIKASLLDSSAIKHLATFDWPGNLRQLRSVVIDALISSSFEDISLNDVITQRMLLWHKEHELLKGGSNQSKLTQAMMFELCGRNYRIAAARLGCSIRDLVKDLQGAKESPR